MCNKDNALKILIESLADQPYQKIQRLRGGFQFPEFHFDFLKIQGSPGANPASIAYVRIDNDKTGLPTLFFHSTINRIALADFLIRRFNQAIAKFAQQNRGRDGSGSFHTVELGQKILQRDCVLFSKQHFDLRFIFSLPGKGPGGGVFDSQQAWQMFDMELKQIVSFVFYYQNYPAASKQQLAQSVDILNTRQQIKRFMQKKGVCVFINNQACLPRKSGIDDRPANAIDIIGFQSPETLALEIPLSNNRIIKGMAIKEGITCITGGGFHGKSTLLQAILAGVYPHVPGDGREYIVTREDAVFIRAEEGRSIRNVNISPYISNLPNGQSTDVFSTENASGSTSQAASIIEACEMQSRLLLFDEDTCATNFLVRDELINQVLEPAREPIRPLYSSLRSIWKQQGISMIFVVGGLGCFLKKADTCLLMDNYHCFDITATVRKRLGEIDEQEDELINFHSNRFLATDNFKPGFLNTRLKKTLPKRIKVLRKAHRQLEYGMDLICLDAIPQIAESPQMLSIGYCLLAIRQAMEQQPEKNHSIATWLHELFQQLDKHGLSFLNPDYPGTLSMPRTFEVAAAINRLRSLKIKT